MSSDVLVIYIYIFSVLGFELRDYTLSHSTSPFMQRVFSRQGLMNYLPRLASNHNPLNDCS
jgi:hypothetical protein